MKNLSDQMIEINNNKSIINELLEMNDSLPYSEVDIRFTKLCEFIETQDQKVKDTFYLALNFSVAYLTKFIDPILNKEINESDKKLIKNVEDALKRFGLEKLMVRKIDG